MSSNNSEKIFENKILPYIFAAIFFIVLAVIYCKPVLDGKVLFQSDIKSWQGMAHESVTYVNKDGNGTYWTNSMFSGMPNYQIGNRGMKIEKINIPFQRILHLFFSGNSPLFFIIGYFIGFFIMLRCFNVNRWLSVIGSIAIAFSSYFFIIIAAGHNSKAECLGELAPIIGGFFLIFRQRKYILGAALVAVYSSFAYIKHPQMAYYILFMMMLMGIAEIVLHCRDKQYKELLISLAIFLAATGVGVGTRYAAFRSNSEYARETMRGGHSDLASVNAENKTNKKSGLSFDYVTQWSYGIDETMTLMIPNFMGGASGYDVGTNSAPYKELVSRGVPASQAKEVVTQLPTYWGDQPFTSGPVYVGAIICFLFLLGLLIVPGPYKWALFASTVLSILLSWGYHFPSLSKFFYNYVPFYAKFRTVSSILVVAEIAMPLLGFLAIKECMDGKVPKDKIFKSILWSAGITAGISLIVALFGPSMFSFRGASDAQLAQYYPDWLMNSIVAQRKSMMRADAWRSFALIAASAGLLWFYVKDKMKFGWFVAGLGTLVLIDMWPVDKRFLNDGNFVTPSQDKNYFSEQPYEAAILQDDDPYFRVFNVTSDTFNDSRTSYYLKSVGGYHAAKLRRYQDIIDKYLSKGNEQVLDMLNTKYFIVPGKNKEPMPVRNPGNMGNAWFVDNVTVVDTPDAECDSIGTINLRTTAVTDKQFAKFAVGSSERDSTAGITLTKYAPDELNYQSHSSVGKTAVFSDIYYPYGWKAYIDGKPAEHFRADYLLRALNIPAGDHAIRFEFRPASMYKGCYVSFAFRMLMTLFALFAVVYYIVLAFRKPKGGTPAPVK
jgi:hypothetical protein